MQLIRGVNLRDGDQVVGAGVVSGQFICVPKVTEKGYGKRTLLCEYPTKGKGLKQLISQKNGPLAGLMTVNGQEDPMIITITGGSYGPVLQIFHKLVASTMG